MFGIAIGIFWRNSQKTKKSPVSKAPNASVAPNNGVKQRVMDVYSYRDGDFPSEPQENQVYYTDSGFNPKTLTTRVGAIVTFLNLNKTKKLLIVGTGSVQTTPVEYGKNIGLGMLKTGTFKFSNQEDPGASVEILVQ